MPLYNIKHFWINRRTAGKVNPEVFFIAHLFQHQKSIGQCHQRDMMMPSLPRATFKVIQSHFPFHLLVILLNTKASLRLSDQRSERNPMRRQTGKPVLPWFVVLLQPFDQQFFRLLLHRLASHQSMGHPHDDPSKTGRERPFRPFSPNNLLPTLSGQVFGNLTKIPSRRKFFCIKPLSRNGSSPFHRRLSRMRIFRPSRQTCTDLNHVMQLPNSQPLTEFVHIPVSQIGQDQAVLQSPRSDFIYQIQSQLRLRLKSGFLWNSSFLPSDGVLDPLRWKIQSPIQGCTRLLGSQIQRHRHLTIRRLPQGTTILSCHSYRMLSLLRKRYLVNKPIGFGNKFPFHFPGQRRSDLLRRPGALVHKLLQCLNVSIRKTISHRLDGFTVSVHQKASYVLRGMLSPLFATHRQNYISQEGLQLQPESFYLSGFHTREYIPKDY